MNKYQAAEFLGVSVRTLQRMAQRGEVAVGTRRGKFGEESVFDEADLQRYKDRAEQTTFITRQPMLHDTQREESLTAIATRHNFDIQSFVETVTRALDASAAGRNLPGASAVHVVAPDRKLTLSLVEAAALAGLSKGFLSAAIHAKKLKAAKRGRGWNIKRDDLDAYIKKL